MALKSVSAGWRLIVFGALAAILLTVVSPALAEDAQEAVRSAVDSDQIQRDRPLAERARESVGEVQKQPDIQHNPPAQQPVEAVPPASPGIAMDLSWLPYVIIGLIGIALAFIPVLGVILSIALHVLAMAVYIGFLAAFTSAVSLAYKRVIG